MALRSDGAKRGVEGRREPVGPLRGAAVALIAAASAVLASGGVGAQEQPPRSVVLVVRCNEGTDLAELERRFPEELALMLEGSRVEAASMPAPQEGQGPLSERLAQIAPLAAAAGADVAVWLEPGPQGDVVLQLAAMGQRRAVIRATRVPWGDDVAGELALAVREQLPRLGLEEPEKPPPERPKEPPPKSPPPAEEDEAAQAVIVGVAGGASAVLAAGLRLRLGGFFEYEVRPAKALALRAGAAFGLGLWDPDGVEKTDAVSFEPGVAAAVLVRRGAFSFGPRLDVGARLLRVRVALEGGGSQEFVSWAFRPGLGLDARVGKESGAALFVSAGVGAWLPAQTLRRRSDDRAFHATGPVDASLRIGAAFGF